jgi:cation diffusion facilitator family transporter
MRPRVERLPEAQRQALARARRIQGVWLFALGTITVAVYFSLGNSQAMKTAWIEDLLSFVPPIAFLIASWIEGWAPNDRFPFGFIRVTSIAYLVSAVALAGVGIFLIVDSALALIATEHPTIGSMQLFGVTFWFGWVMIAALVYSALLPAVFGRLKLAPAQALHDKTLWADALMNKADWMTALAAITGILGIGMGWWWADAVAAIVISLDVLHDGVKHTGAAIRDLSDEMPRTIDDSEFDPLIKDVQERVDRLPWVAESRLRLREEGRFLTGTVYVVPRGSSVPPEWLEEAERDLLSLGWRLHDVSIMLRTRIERPPTGRTEEAPFPSPPRPGALAGRRRRRR